MPFFLPAPHRFNLLYSRDRISSLLLLLLLPSLSVHIKPPRNYTLCVRTLSLRASGVDARRRCGMHGERCKMFPCDKKKLFAHVAFKIVKFHSGRARTEWKLSFGGGEGVTVLSATLTPELKYDRILLFSSIKTTCVVYMIFFLSF